MSILSIARQRSTGDPREYRADDRIDLSDVVDGWQPVVETFFG
jgi:hypothetical protein